MWVESAGVSVLPASAWKCGMIEGRMPLGRRLSGCCSGFHAARAFMLL